MKLLKKNQLAILVISLMLITAGYLSYGSGNNNQTMRASSKPEENPNIASIGDAELVNTNVTEENKENKENKEKEEQAQTPKNITPSPSTSQDVKDTSKQEKTANTNITSDEYFTNSKLERNVMYSQMTARYQEIISSNTRSTRTKNNSTRRNKQNKR